MERDIRVFYMMNGQIIFAEFLEEDDDNGDYIIQHATMVMIGNGKQIQMSTAYPFNNIDDKIALNWRQVTTSSKLDWNPSLINEYDGFWKQLRAKAAGIEIVPAGGGPRPTGPQIVK